MQAAERPLDLAEDRARGDVAAQQRGDARVPAPRAHELEQARVVIGLLDDGADGPRARVRARDHLGELSLELVVPVGEHAEELEVVDRVRVHDLHEVADDAVARREEPDRVGHRRRLLEHAQELVEPEVQPLRPVVVGGRRRDPEAQHVDAADQDLQPRRDGVDHARGAQLCQARVELAAVEVAGEDAAEARQLAAHVAAAAERAPHQGQGPLAHPRRPRMKST